MERTLIKFGCSWRKISRKDGCKGVSEIAPKERGGVIQCMLHMLTYFSFVSSLLPLSGCVIQSIRIKKEIAATTPNSDGLPILKYR